MIMKNSQQIRPMSGKVNPSPRTIANTVNDLADKEFQKILDGILGEDYLRQAANQDNLSQVTEIQIRVNSSYQSLLDLSTFLPNLSSLTLDSSSIGSIRDLGVGLRQLRALSLKDCGLVDLDGIGVLTGLTRLFLQNNCITDVAPLAMHENIMELDLSNNRLSELSITDALTSCPTLQSITLKGNPICLLPHYRLVVASLIGTLVVLDGTGVDMQAKSKVTSVMIAEALEMTDTTRASQASVLRGVENRKQMASFSPMLNGSTISSGGGSGDNIPDTGSLLTHGSSVVLAGNMAAAMRQRQRQRDREMESRDGEDLSGIPYNPLDKRGSRQSEWSNSYSDAQPLWTEESALSVLDNARDAEITGRPGSSRGKRIRFDSSLTAKALQDSSSGMSFIGEGDVTHNEAIRGPAKLHKNALENAGGSFSGAHLFLSVESLSFSPVTNADESYEFDSKPCTPPRPHSSGGGGSQRDMGMGKVRCSSLSITLGEGNDSNEKEYWKNKSNRMTVYEGGGLQSREVNKKEGEECEGIAGREGDNCGRSPRQQNGRRPVSASSYSSISGGRGDGSGDGLSGRAVRAPSASFKIAVEGRDLADLKARITAKRGSSSRTKTRGAIFGDLIGDTAAGAVAWVKEGGRIEGERCLTVGTKGNSQRDVKRAGTADEEENSATDDEEEYRRGYGHQRHLGNALNGTPAPRSIVHRDLVRRHFSTPKTDMKAKTKIKIKVAAESRLRTAERGEEMSRNGRHVVVGNAEEKEEEEIIEEDTGSSGDSSGDGEHSHTAVAHDTRYRLMSASTRKRTPVNGIAYTDKSVGSSTAAAYGLLNGVETGLGSGPKTALGAALARTSQTNTSTPIAMLDRGNSRNQEVKSKQQTTRLDSGSGMQSVNTWSSISNPKKESSTSSSRAGSSLGFDLMSSLAAIGQWVDDMDSEEEGEDLNKRVEGMRLDERGTPVYAHEDKHAIESAVSSESDGDLEDCHGDVICSKGLITINDNYGGVKDATRGIASEPKTRSKSFARDTSERKTSGWCKEKEKGNYRDKEKYKPTKILSRDAILHMCTSSSSGSSPSSNHSTSTSSSSQIASHSTLRGAADGQESCPLEVQMVLGADSAEAEYINQKSSLFLSSAKPYKTAHSVDPRGEDKSHLESRREEAVKALQRDKDRSGAGDKGRKDRDRSEEKEEQKFDQFSNLNTVKNGRRVLIKSGEKDRESYQRRETDEDWEREFREGNDLDGADTHLRREVDDTGRSTVAEGYVNGCGQGLSLGLGQGNKLPLSKIVKGSNGPMVPGSTVPPFPSPSQSLSDAGSIGTKPERRNTPGIGEAVHLSDESLVELLSLPPKSVLTLRTKSGYLDFFRGVNAARMRMLLEMGYARMAARDVEPVLGVEETALKVKRRMAMLRHVLVD